jgi:hypothetical protein
MVVPIIVEPLPEPASGHPIFRKPCRVPQNVFLL